MKRRQAIKKSALIAGTGLLSGSFLSFSSITSGSSRWNNLSKLNEEKIHISLAQWSLHRSIYGGGNELPNLRERLLNDPKSVYLGELDPLDFPIIARQKYGIDAVEYVNVFYFAKAEDHSYLSELKNRCDGEGVKSVLIMCDQEGDLGASDTKTRLKGVENHYRWVNAAKFLGCHSIRVNAGGDGSYAELQKTAADGLRKLCEYADPVGINIIVENHGGFSSNGQWLSGVMKMVNHPRIGTLPDFGNFNLGEGKVYDRYKGVEELMPFAKDVSAKSIDFDDQGNESTMDYDRLLDIVLKSGYSGYMGIEYEGSRLSEDEGIRATKALLERLFAKHNIK